MKYSGLNILPMSWKVGTDSNKQSVGADFIGCSFGDGGDIDGMVVGSRCSLRQSSQQRVAGITEFQQAEIGLHAKRLFNERQQAGHGGRGNHDAETGPRSIFEQAYDDNVENRTLIETFSTSLGIGGRQRLAGDDSNTLRP